MAEKSPRPHYAGHRERLRDRFMKAGAAALHDYELLELILFRAIPRRDVKPLAKTLLERFGDLAGVLSAEPARLREVPGLGEAAVVELCIIEAAAHRLGQARATGREVLGSWQALMAYCKGRMARNPVEEFRVLFLDHKNQLIIDEVLGRGTVNNVPVYPREVVKRALEHNASAIVLLHNHPSGDPTPSRADITMTQKIVEAAKAVDIQVHDHIIIGRDMDASFRQLELI